MKTTAKLLCALLAAILLLTACSGDSGPTSELLFSFSSDAEEYSVSKNIFLNEDVENLVLTADLKMEGEWVQITVTELETGAHLWGGGASTSTDFEIHLTGIAAGTEMVITVEATNCVNVELTIQSDHKLAETPEIPEVPEKPNRS